MHLQNIAFATTDWARIPREEKSAEAGQAFWRTQTSVSYTHLTLPTKRIV